MHLENTLVGLKLTSRGTTNSPHIIAEIFLEGKLTAEKLERIEKLLVHCLGADVDLSEFYAFAKEDSILRYVVDDLYGMHNTSMGDNVFPWAILTILLQMAPLKRSNEMMDCIIRRYGDVAEFDQKTVYVWPLPQKLASMNPIVPARECRVGYRAKRITKLAAKLAKESFSTLQELEKLSLEDAKKKLLELPGIGDYSADIINPHGGFPIDVWSAEVFSELFFGKAPDNKRQAVKEVKTEGIRRWGKWSWMAFFYIAQDLESLSRRLNVKLRLA